MQGRGEGSPLQRLVEEVPLILLCSVVLLFLLSPFGFADRCRSIPAAAGRSARRKKVLQLKKRVTYPLAEPVPQKRQGWGRAPLSHWWCTW